MLNHFPIESLNVTKIISVKMREPNKVLSKKELLKLRDFSDYPFMNLSLVDMPGEEWLEIPEVEGSYLVSNYGRVKSLPRIISRASKTSYSKEYIVAQSLAGRYNEHTNEYILSLQIGLRYEKQRFLYHVNRLVYEIFVGIKDFEPEKFIIIHKDGDKVNNRVENLEINNRTNLYYGLVKEGRRIRERKMPAKAYNQVGVNQYDLQGNLIQYFQSVTEAANAMHIKVPDLKKVLINQEKQFKGFVFRYETDTYEGEYANFSKTKKVSQYSVEGVLLKTYESVIQAHYETGISADTISKCALLKTKFASGFVWRYEGSDYKGEYTKRVMTVAVHQYDKSGEFIQEFATITAAAESVNIAGVALSKCLGGRGKTCGGYVWRYKDQPYYGEHKDHHQQGKPVAQLDQQGKVIATFISISSAIKATGIPHVAIQKNIIGETNSAGGFVWRRATTEEIKELPKYIPVPKPQRLNSISVCQYTKDGEKIASFSSISEASKITRTSKQTIETFLSNPNHVNGNFIWRVEGDSYNGELKDTIRGSEAKRITQYDLEGNKIKVYSSGYEAMKTAASIKSSIGLVLNGKLKSAGGFIWQYGEGSDKLDMEVYYAKFEYENPRNKSVSCYDMEGNKKGFYKSLGEASRENNVSFIGISLAVNGKNKTAFGLIWIYGDGPDKIDIESYFLKDEVKETSQM
jgi:NUMOD4 motif/HNH endonuclease/NUMOD1 domain